MIVSSDREIREAVMAQQVPILNCPAFWKFLKSSKEKESKDSAEDLYSPDIFHEFLKEFSEEATLLETINSETDDNSHKDSLPQIPPQNKKNKDNKKTILPKS
ncbi:MAG: hypothetical protein AABZ60_21855, partial [Planctomycetota bacterium]